MKLKVLVDNNTYIDQYYYGEPAVSYYIEDGERKILFDLGYSDLFIRNAEKMDIDLKAVDTIVVSHGHNDHIGGLRHYFDGFDGRNVHLYAHPHGFCEKVFEDEYIGSPMTEEETGRRCNLITTVNPVEISGNMYMLGEIPCVNDFEKRIPLGMQKLAGKLEDDYILDDTAIAYKGKEGCFVVTGCSHSGICNIVEQAIKVTGQENITGIIGGFHLFDVDERARRTVDYLKKWTGLKLYPCHCTSLDVKVELHRAMKVFEVGVCMELDIK